MKALLLSHIPIFPAVGGDRVRLRQTLSFLLDRYEVDVAHLIHNEKAVDMSAFEPRIGAVWSFRVSLLQRIIQSASTLFNRQPFAMNLFYHRPMQKLVSGIAMDYDLIVCGSPATARYVMHLSPQKQVLDMTDSLTMNYLNEASRLKGVYRWLKLKDARRMLKFEQSCGNFFRRIAYISEKDRTFAGLDLAKTVVVANYVRMPESKKCKRLKNRIIFVGKMNYAPNVAAVSFFVKEVMPNLPDDVEFFIVGSNPTAEVVDLGNHSQVTVTGFVESVSDYYEQATLVVAPMLSGSGVQNKIIEAMAYGNCVVTTPLGAEGLDAVVDGLVVCQAAPSVFADTVKSLMRDYERRDAIGRKAAELIAKNYNYDAVSREFSLFLS